MRSRSLPRLLAAMLAALLLLGAGAAPANAKPKTAASKITLKLDAGIMQRLNPWTFHGRVSSKVARCERGRRVELTYKPEGGGAQPYGEATTNGDGRYEIVQNIAPEGRYVARVLPAKKGNVACGGARSEPVVVGEIAAAAAKPKVKTTPTLRFDEGFKGRLKTQKRCKPQRVVKLFETAAMGPDEELAKRTTNKRGRFDFGDEVLPDDGGTFYVRVSKRTTGSAVCLKGRSKSLSFAG